MFTSEGSKHCIIFISASHTLNQNRREGRCPLLAAEIPIVPFLFILFLLLLRDQWSRCNTYYRGFQDQRISWRWLEINLHNPPRSFSSPSLPFLLISFPANLGNTAERGHPERGITAIWNRGHDCGGREAMEPHDPGACSALTTKVLLLHATCKHRGFMHQNNNRWIINNMLKWQSLWAYLGYDLQHQEMKHLLDLRGNGTGYTSHWSLTWFMLLGAHWQHACQFCTTLSL